MWKGFRRTYAVAVRSASTSVTLADVARLAGVSSATASRALSDHPHVAAATRARVLRVADELAYVVSPDASRLAAGSTGRVAVVVPHLSRWFFGAVLEGLEAALREAGIDLLLYRVGDATQRRAFFDRLPVRRKVDAIVVVGLAVEGWERERLELMGVDIVAAGGQVAGHPFVRIDDHGAGRQAVDHLIHLGHRRIGMIAAVDPDRCGRGPEARSAAYRDALADAGVEVDEELVAAVDPGGAGGARGMARLLGLREPPTAVFAHSDEAALGAVRTLRRAGLRVPDDASVVGIDDHPLADLADLTTVGRPAREQGVAAGAMVRAVLRGEEAGPGITLPTQLVLRGSTAPPRGRRRRPRSD